MGRIGRDSHAIALMDAIDNGKAYFEFLGVDFDIITLRQTLAFALRIDDIRGIIDNTNSNDNFENEYYCTEELEELESYIREEGLPVMAETAATYNLLKKNHLYMEIEENNFEKP